MGFLSRLFGSNENSHSDKKENSNQVPNLTFTTDQKERRTKSEEFCKSKGIPIYKNPYAMYFEPENEVAIRTKDEVIDRTLGLCAYFLKADKLYKDSLPEKDNKFKIIPKFISDEGIYLFENDPSYEDFQLKYNTDSKLTPFEKDFIDTENPSPQERSNAFWRIESINVLLWALKMNNFLSYPNRTSEESGSAEMDIHKIYTLTEKEFRENTTLRTKAEILDEADLILRLNWACVNSRIKNEPPPSDLNPTVVFLRHWTLNWLTNYMGQDWDDIKTDT
jgi:hypothetical protein